MRRHVRRLLGNRVPPDRPLPDDDFDEVQGGIAMLWGFVRHRVCQNTQDKVAQEQLVHDECQGKKEGI
eukprot:6750760-Pyramimonas_sp.AAC.1